jgi:NADPH:quinone reductase-like Zn-dependent oxidoreductase
MRAMRIRQPATLESIAIGAADERAPGPGEIKVRIRAGSLNFRDNLVATGFFPAPDSLIPLSDGAGDVVAVGDGVIEFTPGDAVVSTFHPNWLDGHIERVQLNNTPGGPADGFACEFATRPASHFTHAPKGLTHAEAATLTCAGVTAWRALVTDGHVKAGDHVLVLGTGGVSLFALQFAKAVGAVVIATSSSTEKLDRLKTLGADHVINYREVEKWAKPRLRSPADWASTMWSRSAAPTHYRSPSLRPGPADISRSLARSAGLRVEFLLRPFRPSVCGCKA